MEFYSARLLYIMLVNDDRPLKKNYYDDSVVVFRAKNFDHAFEKALEIGKDKESEYKNYQGQKVRWALVEIVNIDWVGRKIDGKEVASNLHYRISKKRVPANKKFFPEKSEPEGSF